MPEDTADVGGTILDKSMGFSGCSGNLGIFFDILVDDIPEEEPFLTTMLLALPAAVVVDGACCVPWRQLMDFFRDEGVVDLPDEGLCELYSLKG